MVKPEWGEKRVCHSCKALFYDLQRRPIICPKCSAEFNPEVGKKPRRTKGSKLEDSHKIIQQMPLIKEMIDGEESVGDLEEIESIDEISLDDDDFIEDTSDLGDGEEDVDEILDLPKRVTD